MKNYKFHIKELQTRLRIICIIFISLFILSYIFSGELYLFILHPLSLVAPVNYENIYTNLTEPIFTYLKISAFFAFFLTIPFILYNTYNYLSPGLYPIERSSLQKLFITGCILFYTSLFFVYYIIFPNAWQFLISIANNNLINDNLDTLPVLRAKMSEYLTLSLRFMLAFALAFQLPILIIVLSKLNLLSKETLRRGRKLAIILILIFAAIITPPDIYSQILLFVPMLLLYELSIFFCNSSNSIASDRHNTSSDQDSSTR